MITFDLFADSDRHAALLLNKALSRTKENNNLISPNRICETVTASGINAQKEIKQVLEAFNILYGFDKDKLIPGVILDTRITNPTVIPSITKKQVLDACQNVNSYKLHDHRMQVSFTKALSTTDRNPDETVHLFLDDVGTPRQRDTRKTANHDAVPRATKTVQTTNGAVMSKEGIYYLSANSTDEMMMLMRGYMLKNHLLENRDLSCFSDGAKVIWSNYDKWFGFRPRKIYADWYHLVHKSNELFSRILVGGKKYEEEVKKIKREYFAILWTGNITKVIEYLHSIPAKYIKTGRNVGLLVDYLESKQEHHTIPVFALRKKLHQVNSSSRSETANCSMTTSRQKKQGKSWCDNGSHAKTTWRNLHANDEAVNYLNHLPLRLSPVRLTDMDIPLLNENNIYPMIPT